MFKVGDTVVVTSERWSVIPINTVATIVEVAPNRRECWIMNATLPNPPSYGGYLHHFRHIRKLTKLDKALK